MPGVSSYSFLPRVGHGGHERERRLRSVHPGALHRNGYARLDSDRIRHTARDLDAIHLVRPYVPGALRRDDDHDILDWVPVLEVEGDGEPRPLRRGVQHADCLVTLMVPRALFGDEPVRHEPNSGPLAYRSHLNT